MLGLDTAVDDMLAAKSIREWYADATANGRKIGEYIDTLIREFLTTEWKRGMLTRAEYEAARERWGV